MSKNPLRHVLDRFDKTPKAEDKPADKKSSGKGKGLKDKVKA